MCLRLTKFTREAMNGDRNGLCLSRYPRQGLGHCSLYLREPEYCLRHLCSYRASPTSPACTQDVSESSSPRRMASLVEMPGPRDLKIIERDPEILNLEQRWVWRSGRSGGADSPAHSGVHSYPLSQTLTCRSCSSELNDG